MELKLTIKKMTNKGFGISSYKNKNVFIDGTFPGEEVLVDIIDEHPTFFNARILKILLPSKNRIINQCTNENCGGCQFLHCSYKHQLELKKEYVLNCLNLKHIDISKISFVNCIGDENLISYRNKSIYYVRNVNKKNMIGMFLKNSHIITNINNCLMDPSWIETINKEIISWMNKYCILGYNEIENTGLIKEVIYRTGYQTNEKMVILVTTETKIPHLETIVDILKSHHIDSIYININDTQGNNVYGNTFKLLGGQNHILTKLNNLTFKLGPRSFWQINSRQCIKLYNKIIEFAKLTGKETVFDLYCGAGSISLYLSKYVKRIIGVEIISDAVKNAQENALLNNIYNCDFIIGESENIYSNLIKEHGIPDLVIIDPPRKGCDQLLINDLNIKGPKKIIYVSCLPESLARDLQMLTKMNYLIEKMVTVDMFPNTLHVETVVLLSRN